jgi:hypothetical protein
MDGLLKLIDRIIDLLRERERNERLLFEQIIEPLFKDAELVVQQYFEFFNHAKGLLSAEPRIAVKEVAATLTSKRSEHLHLRLKLTELANAVYDEIPDRSVCRFVENLLWVFRLHRDNRKMSKSDRLEFIHILALTAEDWGEGNRSRDALQQKIDVTLHDTERAYVALNTAT